LRAAWATCGPPAYRPGRPRQPGGGAVGEALHLDHEAGTAAGIEDDGEVAAVHVERLSARADLQSLVFAVGAGLHHDRAGLAVAVEVRIHHPGGEFGVAAEGVVEPGVVVAVVEVAGVV